MIGVDGSACCSRAVEYAVAQAKPAGSKVLVTHVIEWSRFSFSTAEENEQRHKRREEEIERALTDVVNPVVTKLKEQGVEAEGLVRHGHVSDTIRSLAKKHHVNNIIIGRQGSTGLKSYVFGSVGARLVQVAECPVTVVP
jgi:nucleotide-binding universal stress UspA family protein